MAEIPVIPTLSHYSQLKLHFFFSSMNTKASLQLLLFPQPISLPHHILTNPYEEEEEEKTLDREREREEKKKKNYFATIYVVPQAHFTLKTP